MQLNDFNRNKSENRCAWKKRIAAVSVANLSRGFASRTQVGRGALMVFVAALCATAMMAFAAQAKRFQGGVDGTLGIIPVENDPSRFAIHFSGTGVLTHFGSVTLVLDSLAIVDAAGNPSRVPGTSKGTITTANGDQISYTLTWIGTRNGDQIHATGTVTALSGTGRFNAITASGDFEALANLSTYQMSVKFQGTVATR